MRPVLRYFGGKYLLAPWIISHFPTHRIYCEPFGGAGSVLMQKARSYAEVYNDLDGEVVNVFKVLRDKEKAKELEHRLRLTPFAREEFNNAYTTGSDDVERAAAMMIRSYMGFGSDGHNIDKGRTGFRANSSRSGTTPAHDWANFPKSIEMFCDRLAGVVIENRDAKEVMLQQDSEDTLHFLDPPYVHSTRGAKHGYRFEMTDEDGNIYCWLCLREIKNYPDTFSVVYDTTDENKPLCVCMNCQEKYNKIVSRKMIPHTEELP